ncbi:MAG: tRNA pseudouridine(38-40) synthase TruA [Actinomycetota bacterium]
MVNYMAVLEYDGTDYCGFQLQPQGVPTIQGQVEEALCRVLGQRISISYSGRTDAGVHALRQVISFKVRETLDLYRFQWSLNCVLPDDIGVKEISKADDGFDARRSAKKRQYCYYVVNHNVQSVFLRKYSILITQKLDLEAMRAAAGLFVGVRDFEAFCNRGSYTGSTVRKVYAFDIQKTDQGLLVFKITASSFLYNMVRIIVGSILELGRGSRSLESIEKALKAKDRNMAGKAAPAKGLFLTGVFY